MVSFPPCKINLGLHIINKRPDGYHDLETCFYPIPWTDILEIVPSDEFAFTHTGNEIPGMLEENLCVKAYWLLKRDFDVGPAKIHLHKIIPSGAGLGGGSADAAYTLRLLDDIFKLNISQESLMAYAGELGSDCPFFIQDHPMLGTARGEVLSKISVALDGKYLVLVKPSINVSTAAAYAGIVPKQPEHSILQGLQSCLANWKYLLKNDFEESVFSKHPAIKAIKEKMYLLGAVYASMSGSGSAVFGIFERGINLEHEFPGAAVWSGLLRDGAMETNFE